MAIEHLRTWLKGSSKITSASSSISATSAKHSYVLFCFKFLLLSVVFLFGILYCQSLANVGETVMHVMTNITAYHVPEIPGSLFCLLKSLLAGLLAVYYSWEIIYFDSVAPGILPPSPLSPSRIRAVSKREFDLNHLLAVVNGVFFAVLVFYWA